MPLRLEAEGAFAGIVTSAIWSPRFEANVAIAMIERDYWESGNPLSIEMADGSRRNAEVCDLPFPEA